MKLFPLLVLLLLVTGCSRVKPTEGPLQVNTPPDWTVKLSSVQGNDFYTINLANGKNDTYVQLIAAPGIPASKISLVMDKYPQSFVAQEAQQGVKIESDIPERADINGASFHGEYELFSLPDGTKGVYFMVSDGARTWQGKYFGPEDGWKTALEILKGIQKK